MFLQPNMAITLAWGWCFLLIAIFSVVDKVVPSLQGIGKISVYVLNAVVFIFQMIYLKGATTRFFPDVDRTISRLRASGYAGLLIAVAFFMLILVQL